MVGGAENYDNLFNQYIDICNQAIQENKEKFPYRQIWNVGFKNLMEGYNQHFTIYDDRPKGLYRVGMAEDASFTVENNTIKNEPEKPWPLNYTYLKHVIDNAEEHIKNPAKLNWSWLKGVGE